jgi:hypothetical protein
MKTKTLEFKSLSVELEEVLMDSLHSIKGGWSDAADFLAWAQDFYDNHGQGTYEFNSETGEFQGLDGPLIVCDADGMGMISWDGGSTWGNLIGGNDEVTIHGPNGEFNITESEFNAAAFNNFIFDMTEAFEELGITANISELIADGTNNLAAAKAFAKIGAMADAIGVALDLTALYNFYKNNEGDMDAFKFTIETSSTGASIMAASIYGGPYGVLVGTMAATAIELAPQAWEGFTLALRELGGQFHNNYSNGWLPSP